MGLFGAKGERVSIHDRKLDDSEYRSTIKGDDHRIIGMLDKNVSVIIKNETALDHHIDYSIYICLTGKACAETMKNLRAKKGDTISAKMMRLGNVLLTAFDRQECRAVFLYGLSDLREVIAKRDLECIKELLEDYNTLYRRAVGEMTTLQVYEKLKKKFVYVVGTLPRLDANGTRRLTPDIDVEKFEWIGDDARTSALCYLDKRTAKVGRPDALTSSIRLGEFTEGFGSVILEGNSANWLEFNASDLDLI